MSEKDIRFICWIF